MGLGRSSIGLWVVGAAFAVAVVVAMGVGGGLVWAQTVDDDHGDTTATATELALGASASGEIDPPGDWDFFRLDLSERTDETDVWLYTTGELDTLLYLFSGAGSLLLLNDDSYIAGRRTSSNIRATVEPGVYYVLVRGYRAEVGEYGLHSQAVEKPRGSRDSATVLSLDAPLPGRLDDEEDADYFRIFVKSPTNLVIYAIGLAMRDSNFALVPVEPLEPTVTDSQGTELDLNIYRWTLRTPAGRAWFGFQIEDGLERGHYYIKVAMPEDYEAEGPAPYTIHMYQDVEYDEFLAECEEASQESDKPGIDDSLYACQWHLSNENDEDVNVEGAWEEGVLGEGVTVAVVDSGLFSDHEDLRDNVDTSRNHDYRGEGDVYSRYLHHGTLVAGIIAGRDNSIGVRGVAPRATIYSYNLLRTNLIPDVEIADAMVRNYDVTAVSNNSWGSVDDAGLGSAPSFWELAVETGVTIGYEGKGIFYAFAAGNGHRLGDHSNLDELANYYAVTAVCAVNEVGMRSNYSETGSNLWVCAPSDDLRRDLEGDYLYRGTVTTDHEDRYYDDFGGTSSATPVVSGTAALMRSVNEDLSWRDLKLILAATARKTEPDNPGWETGAQKYMSDSEDNVYEFNEEYGFGVVDVSAAVEMAKDWTSVPRLRSESAHSDSQYRDLRVEIEEPNELKGLSQYLVPLNVDVEIDFIEFVEVNVEIEHESFRDLEIWLESPLGTVSTLSVPFDTYNDLDPSIDHVKLDGEFRFGSARHLGENPNGYWRLGLMDYIGNGIEGSLVSFEIKVYGHEPVPGVPWVVGVTELGGALRAWWTPPGENKGPEVTSYDVRYIETAEDESDDENWTLEEEAWTSEDGGELEYRIEDLTVGTEYGVQVRAANRSGPGPWSETRRGTPWTPVFCERGAVTDTEGNPGLVSDCELLLRSRDTLAGSATLNWEEDEAMSEWDGVTLSGTPERVTRLELQWKGLDGEIASELSGLSELRRLYLHGNSLSGTIPADLGKLTNLERLYLYSNELSGEIPDELGGMTKLTHMFLHHNQLRGKIPAAEWDGLDNLVWLSLYSNDLSGGIPTELTGLAKLERLYLHENRNLGGEIPAELGQMSSLTHLRLLRTGVSGPIPDSLSKLSKLVWLSLYDNELTGEIPTELGGLAKLQRLYLHVNKLSGPIPSQLGGLTALTNLWLNDNELSGAIPVELDRLTNLERWRLRGNQLTGCVPAGLAAVENSDLESLGLETCASE